MDFTPFTKDHDIRFVQDCLSVAVDYAETEDYHGWNSTIATLISEKGRVGLRYAYEVKYKEGKDRDLRLPVASKGLEEVFVVGHKDGRKPNHITGSFVHTADGPRPRFRGDVVFHRTPNEPDKRWYCRLLRLVVRAWLKPPAR